MKKYITKRVKSRAIDLLCAATMVSSFALAIGLLSSGIDNAVAANQGAAGAACSEMRAKVLAAESREASDEGRQREARYLANEGKSLCETQHAAEGVDKYRQALGVLEGSSAQTAPPSGGST